MQDTHRELSSVPLASRWHNRVSTSRNQILQAAAVFCALLLAATSLAQTSPATLPNVQFTKSGLVLSLAHQEDGKVLIGGYFSLVNGVTRSNLARLNADGSVDETWDPGANNAVRQIVVSGTDIFVLGDFTAIGGQSRKGLAKLSTTADGAADPIWNPAHPGNLHALALSGTSLFVGGLSYLARLSTTGTSAGEAPWGPQPDYNINALAVHGDNLYVAGNFTWLGQFNRSRLAKISTLGEGEVDPAWDPQAAGGNLGYIPALAVTDRFLYVGGSFDQIGGMSRKNVARVSLDGTGEVDPLWNPDTDHEMVYALAIADEAVYAGGGFSQVGGLPRNGLAKLSSAGVGAADPLWGTGTDRRWVTALAVNGSSVFAGGNFTTINGVVSLSVAKLNPVSGACDGSFPAQVGDPGSALAVARQSDGKVIVGGDFSMAGGLPCQNLARFNVDGTPDNTWLPNADGPVTAMAIQGTDIFVAGQFEKIGGQARRFLAKLSATETDEADAMWNPDLSEPVEALAIESTSLFVASSHFGSGTIIKLSTSGAGQRDPSWNPRRFERFWGDPGEPVVKSLAANASGVYVAGNFDSISTDTDSVPRSGLVKLSATGTGAPDLQWDPSYRNGVNALALDDSNLYFAGLFGLARVNVAGTGATDPDWHPDVASGYVNVLAISGTTLYAGGSVTTLSGLTEATLVRLSTTGSGIVDSNWNPNPRRLNYPSRSVVGLVANGADVYVIGDFDTVGGTTRHAFAFLPVADAPLLSEGPTSTIFVRRSPMDGPEVTHFRITTIAGGHLFLPGSPEPVPANSFITVEQGETGLRFIADGTTPAAVAALSALNPTPDGAGNAETTLHFNGSELCSLRLQPGQGLTLFAKLGETYQIEYTDSLNAPVVWLPLRTVTLQADNQIIPIPMTDTPQRFFRTATQRPR
jgi:hypothetical protein